MASPENQIPPPAATPSHRILHKFAYLLTARWLRDALLGIFLILLARKSAATYGEFMLALGLGAILLRVGEFGLNLPLVSLFSGKDRDAGLALGRVLVLKGVLVAGALAGGLIFIQWQGYSPALKQVMLAIAGGVALEALATTFFVACQVQGRQDQESKIKALGAGVGLGYGLITLLAGAAPLTIALFKLIETLVILAAGAILIIPRMPPRMPSFKGIWTLAQQGLIFALIEIAAIIYNKANLFFLQSYGGAHSVAQYSVTQETVEGLSGMVSTLLLQSVIFPLFVKLWDVDKSQVSRLAQNTARWLLTASLPLMWVLFVESDRIILLIYGAQYQDAVWVQKYLVITVVSGYLHNLAALLMISMRRERLLLLFYLSGLAVNLVACPLLIPANPLLGATLAIIITKLTVACLTVSYCQRQVALIPKGPLLHLALAALAGLAAYFLTISYLPRELPEALALAPILALAWRWWRQGSGEK